MSRRPSRSADSDDGRTGPRRAEAGEHGPRRGEARTRSPRASPRRSSRDGGLGGWASLKQTRHTRGLGSQGSRKPTTTVDLLFSAAFVAVAGPGTANLQPQTQATRRRHGNSAMTHGRTHALTRLARTDAHYTRAHTFATTFDTRALTRKHARVQPHARKCARTPIHKRTFVRQALTHVPTFMHVCILHARSHARTFSNLRASHARTLNSRGHFVRCRMEQGTCVNRLENASHVQGQVQRKRANISKPIMLPSTICTTYYITYKTSSTNPN
mmetsp:Transcript_9927/g.21225  ORF Transcript_9927/g.21225 Transcript_9927/m.21225 type:complete len:271 (+) Transcript_9927:232-1044(+)